MHHERCLAAPGLAENPAVPDPFRLFDPEDSVACIWIVHLADGVIAAEQVFIRRRQEDLLHLQAGDVLGEDEVHEVLDLEAFPDVLFQGMAKPEIIPLPFREDGLQYPQLFFDRVHASPRADEIPFALAPAGAGVVFFIFGPGLFMDEVY